MHEAGGWWWQWWVAYNAMLISSAWFGAAFGMASKRAETGVVLDDWRRTGTSDHSGNEWRTADRTDARQVSYR